MKQHIRSLLASISACLPDTAKDSELTWVRNLPGGDVNYAAQIRSGDTDWFIKYHTNAPRGMFAAEASALSEIVSQGCIKAPRPIAQGLYGNIDWLVLEFIQLDVNGPSAQLGESLAALHGVTAGQYGWSQDNYIGTNPQINTRCDNWAEFWRDYRLMPQLDRASEAGHGKRLRTLGEELLENIHCFLGDHQPAPSLLHGDLWAGNKAFTTDGEPVVFDPACYYGDRETDIAMTGLFGGFDANFYAAYKAHAPLPDGHQLRHDLYNLYHMLNHLNLFGRGYLSRCESMIGRLLAEIH